MPGRDGCYKRRRREGCCKRRRKSGYRENRHDVAIDSYGPWASLPRDLVEFILEKLVPISDYIRFSVVCKQWRSVALDQKQRRRIESCHNQLPMLMFRSIQGNPTRDVYVNRALYPHTTTGRGSRPRGRSIRVIIPDHLDLTNNYSVGSSHGWLAYASYADSNLEICKITLVNPFTERSIVLPVKLSGVVEEYIIRKLVLSADPNLFPNGYEVVVMCTEAHGRTKLAHCKFRSDNSAWTLIDEPPDCHILDVIDYKGQVLGVTNKGQMLSISAGGLHHYFGIEIVSPAHYFGNLAQSSEGDILLVQMSSTYKCEVMRVSILKLVMHKSNCSEESRHEWVNIKSIGHDALFFNDDQFAGCVSTLDHPNCRPNSIYSMKYVIDLNSGCLTLHSCLDQFIFKQPDIWILPTMV